MKLENVAEEPERLIHELFQFLELSVPDDIGAELPGLVDSSRVSSWREEFGVGSFSDLDSILVPALRFLGYED